MANEPTTISAAKLALLSRQARLNAPDATLLQSEPIAIVGLACRFPGGASSPSRYWSLLAEGVDAISEVPADRWNAAAMYDADPSAPGKMSTRWGGFLDRIDEFDPKFFGIAPREAASMDPQQRLLLEVSWEALEDAGLTQDALAGSPTGVFVALYGNDYAQWHNSDPDKIDAYTVLGTAHCIACGRLSFLLDLQGPSLVVDTGCSSSLVAVHLACQSLRAGESRTALAAGVNLMLSPEMTISLSKWGFMAADGRCKTFDARADGFVRGEGVGVVVLKRLADALADSDRILAVIRGTAVNEDGRSTVLTAPSGPAQQAVVRQALANGRVQPSEVTYVEAHGTGTALGDPIELEALAEVLGRPATGRPCLVGSVKANLGHLEAAAGIAGLIKTVLALQHERIPPQLHFESLNPHASLDDTRLVISSEGRAWPAGAGRRFAGVSSFGFGGTNAHVVLEEAPQVPKTTASSHGAHLLLVSAKSAESLSVLAAEYEQLVREAPESVGDVIATAALRRTHHDYRLSATGATAQDLADALGAFSRGERRWNVTSGRRPAGRRSGPVFVFSGQGPQWWGMGRQLFETNAVYRETIEAIDAVILRVAGWSLVNELTADEAASRLGQTEFAQPSIYALQVALSAALHAHGVRPAAVVGHSVGEIAAAHVAGALTLEQAVRIVVHRGRLMQRATGLGRMVACAMTPVEAAAFLGAHTDRLSIAALNSPRSVVLAGEPDAVVAAVARLDKAGVACRMLPVNYAFHSHQMAALAPELRSLLESEVPAKPSLPIVSTVTGSLAAAGSFAAEYWVRNLTQTVRFADAVEWLHGARYDTFVEIAPHPVLQLSILESLPDRGGASVVPTLHRDRPDPVSLTAALGSLHVAGHSIDWRSLHPIARPVALPAYAWQHERYWNPRPSPAAAPSSPVSAPGSAFAGRRLRSPALKGLVFERVLNASTPEFVRDHRIHDRLLFPATGFLALAYSAVREETGSDTIAVRDVTLAEPLELGSEDTRIQTILEPEGGGWRFNVASQSRDDDDRWTVHVTGFADLSEVAPQTAALPLASEPARVATMDEHYAGLAIRGCAFGPAFRGVTQLSVFLDSAVAHVDANGADRIAPLDPAVLDACFQAVHPLLPDDGATYVPVGIGSVQIAGPLEGSLRAQARIEATGADGFTAAITVFDQVGLVRARIDGLSLRRASRAAVLRALRRGHDDWLYAIEWETAPSLSPAAVDVGSRWVLAGAGGAAKEALAGVLRKRGHEVNTVDGHGLQPAGSAQGAKIVYFAASNVHGEGDSGGILEDVGESCAGVLALIQASASDRQPHDIWIVTRGARSTGLESAPVDPGQAVLWSLARSAGLELPELSLHCLDRDPAATESVEAIADVLLTPDAELEMALRAGTRFVPRLHRIAASSSRSSRPVRLEVHSRGTLDALRFVDARREAPGRGEVEIQVRATGLNFRDVLNVLGMYPGEAGDPGDECAGTVTAVGEGVEDLRVGDHVVGVARGAFATFALASARMLVRKPVGLSFAEAATVPSAFMTAHHALIDLAKIRAGDKVLIHAAAGGVGLAAVQLAQRAGAQVFATAGSEEKRSFLASLGVPHVLNSRTLDFADEIMTRTEGRGVDVVLNSLAGDFIERSMAVLAPGGRFIEIGRTGVWTAARAAEVRPDVSYAVVFLVEEFERNPLQPRQWLETLFGGIERGELQPLPARVFPLSQTVDAFRHMAQARHIGKVVVAQDGVVSGANAGTAADEGQYLITGGLGALGLRVARALVERGARDLVLVGRSEPSAAARAEVAQIETFGARVRVLQGDVADPACLAVLREALGSTRTLGGIVHAAGTLDDGVVVQQTRDRLVKVLAPKVAGAWNMQRLADEYGAGFFVMFSAGASVLGSRGQTSYAAANAFMDALAHRRHSQGRPAMAINWGAWGEAGMAASLAGRDRQRLAQLGLTTMAPEQGIEVFDDLLQRPPAPQVAVLPVSWSQYVTHAGPYQPFFARLTSGRERGQTSSLPEPAAVALSDRLASAAPASRIGLVTAHVQDCVLRVLGLPPSYALDINQGLRDVGLDSLMAVELRNVLQASVGKGLSATLAFDHPTVAALSRYLAEDILELTPTRSLDSRDRQELPDVIADVGALTDDEAESQLAAELAALQQTQTHGL